jgi:GT2 family glycosyltransferase
VTPVSVSAVICTRGRPDLIGHAAGSVLASDHPSFELLVIDQSPDDSSERALDGFRGDARLRYVHLDRVGLSAAYNTGIRLSHAPLLAFTDDDCIAPRDWLASTASAFERHPDVELLYGQTLTAPELRADPGVVPELPIRREEKLSKAHGFRVYGMGANFAMRRSLVERIGGFDEALGGGGPLRSSQDFDFQYRAYRAGAVCLLSPGVWVHHYGVRRGDEWTATMRAYGVGDGAFYLKHVRCGDLTALRLLLSRIVRLGLRELLNPIRRQPTQWPYLRSYLEGMRRSLRYEIDREKRLYKFAGSQ